MRYRHIINRKVAGVFLALLLSALFSTAVTASDEVIGTCDVLLAAMNDAGARGEECLLGDAAADAVRQCTQADIALVSGGCFMANLQGGDITRADLLRVFPNDEQIAAVQMSVSDLYRLLEMSVETFVLDDTDSIDYDTSAWDGFVQVSGITVCYDVSAPAGERVYRLTIGDEESPARNDNETVVRVAGNVQIFDGTYGFESADYELSDFTLTKAMEQYILMSEGVLTQPSSGRITIIGTADRAFLLDGIISREGLCIIAVVIIIICVYFRMSKRHS